MKIADDMYPERNEDFFLPHRHPHCLPILNTCNQERKEGMLPYVTIHMLYVYLQLLDP